MSKRMFHSHNRAVIHQLQMVTIMRTYICIHSWNCGDICLSIEEMASIPYNLSTYTFLQFCLNVQTRRRTDRQQRSVFIPLRIPHVSIFLCVTTSISRFPMFFFASLIFMSPPTALFTSTLIIFSASRTSTTNRADKLKHFFLNIPHANSSYPNRPNNPEN